MNPYRNGDKPTNRRLREYFVDRSRWLRVTPLTVVLAAVLLAGIGIAATPALRVNGIKFGPNDTSVFVGAYGAVGDGVTDDTTAVQNALTAAVSGGGTLYLPRGTYLLTNTVDVDATGKSIAIMGPGTIMQPLSSAGSADRYFRVRNATSLLVQGVTFQGVALDTTQTTHHMGLIVANSNQVTVRDCRFLNITNLALDITSNITGGVASDVTTADVIIANNYFNNYGQATMSFGGAKRVVISGNTMVDAKLSFIKLGGEPISDTNLPRDVTFTGNSMAYSSGYAPWTATNYHVGFDLRGPWKNVIASNNVFDYRDFTTSSHTTTAIAVYEASGNAGDEIPTSTTWDPVTVSITGNIFEGLTTQFSRLVDGNHEAQEFIFADNEIYGTYDGVMLVNAPSHSQNISHTSLIANNHFRNVLDNAIEILTPSSGTHNTQITGNVIELDAGLTAGSTGVLIEVDPSNATMKNAVVKNNTIINANRGISISSTNTVGNPPYIESAVVTGNRIVGNSTVTSGFDCIDLFGHGATRRHVTDNVVQGCYRGIYMTGTLAATADLLIADNMIDANATGLQTDAMGTTVYALSNLFTNNTTANHTNTTNAVVAATISGNGSIDYSTSSGTLKAPTGGFTSNLWDTTSGGTGTIGGTNMTTLQWSTTGGAKGISVATSAVDTTGVAQTLSGGNGGVASAVGGGAGGQCSAIGGTGGASDGVHAAGAGGIGKAQGGVGGVGVSTIAGGAGAEGQVIGGTGGASSGASGTAGAGGQARINGGPAGAANGGTGAAGGNVQIRGGAGTNGTNGTIAIGDANTAATNIGANGTSMSFISLLQTGIPAKANGSIASATTIAPTNFVTHITGTTTIQTITAPTSFAQTNGGGCLILVFDGVAPWNAVGNIFVAGTPTTAGTNVQFCYDNASTKWYPSRTL